VEQKPIKLDLSAATRKPYYYRGSNAATAVAGLSSSLTSAKTEPISASITDGDQVASEKLDQVEDETVELTLAGLLNPDGSMPLPPVGSMVDVSA
jgi:hypothetical protein